MKNLFSYLIVALVSIFLFLQIKNNWSVVSQINFHLPPTYTLLMLLLVFTVFPLNAYSWHLITRALGSKVSFRDNFWIWMYSNATRFLPGSIWQYMGRVYLFYKAEGSKVLATTALFVESLLNILVALIAVAVAVLWGLPMRINNLWIIGGILLVLLPPFVVLGNKRILRFVLFFLQRVSKKRLNLEHAGLPLRSLPSLVGIFLLHFLAAGTILFLLARGVYLLPLTILPVFAGIYGAAFLFGYLVFFIPSGLGVQEASLAGLMSFYMPFSLAVVVSVLFRLVLLFAEVLAIVPAWWAKKK